MKWVKLNIKILIVIIAIPLAIIFYITFESNDASDVVEPSLVDSDGDRLFDDSDQCPQLKETYNGFQDTDGCPDSIDFKLDSDNDGIINALDAFPLNPEEWDDFDFDGIGANEDEDDDNDGILDVNDTSPSHPSTKLYMKSLDLIENCSLIDSEDSRSICFKDAFISLVLQGENSFEVLNFASSFDKLGVIDDCHHIAHRVGVITFQKNQNLTENMINAEHNCRDGFHHGYLTAYFDNMKKEEKDISSLYKTICDEFVDNNEIRINCVHGIGHGLITYYDDLRQSIDACRELQGKGCINGLFMEYTEDELTKSTSFEEDIPKICSKIELTSEDSMICYSKLGQMLTFRTNHDLEPALEFCDLIKDKEGRYQCSLAVLSEIIDRDPEALLIRVVS